MLTRQEISTIRSLADKKGREKHGLFVAEGRKLVDEIISSDLKIENLYGTTEYSELPGITVVGKKDLERISNLKTPQGVLAVVRIPQNDVPEKPGSHLTLALDGIQDPGNLGTILRIADWFGIRDIFCSPDTADCYGPKVVQAGMGAVIRVRVHYTDLAGILGNAAENSFPAYGTLLEGENVYTTSIDAPSKGVIVLGREGSGIRPGLLPFINHKIKIPAYPPKGGGAESLNVATAAAIICSEFRRRLLSKPQ